MGEVLLPLAALREHSELDEWFELLTLTLTLSLALTLHGAHLEQRALLHAQAGLRVLALLEGHAQGHGLSRLRPACSGPG